MIHEPLTLHDLLSCLLIKLMLLLSSIPLFKRKYDPSTEEEEEEDTNESRPSPSPVQLPVHVIAGSVKNRLPVINYGCLLERLLGGSDSPPPPPSSSSSSCAVCLRCLSESDEVRELCNCSHTFHRECLDGWVDQGRLTCPLCRSNLLLPDDDRIDGKFSSKCEADPWRRERMIYLFGEDCCFQ